MRRLSACSALVVVIVALSAVIAGTATGQADTSTIVLGMETQLSGDGAAYGISNRNGANLAISEINKAGGVLGKKLALQVEDNEGRPDVAVNICTKFVSSGAAVMLSSFSYTSIPCTQVTKGKIPQIAMVATSHVLTQTGNKWIFRIAVPDTKLASDVISYIAKKGYKRIGLMNSNDDFGKAGADSVKTFAQKAGLQIVDSETYTDGDRDFSAQIGKIKSANPDVFVDWGNYAEAAVIAKQLIQFGLNVPHFESDGAAVPDFQTLAGDASSGVIYASTYSGVYKGPENLHFITTFKKKYGKSPDPFAAEAYTAVYLTAQAIKRAGSTAPAALRQALTRSSWTSPMGKFTFNTNGDPNYKTFLVKIVKPGQEQVVFGG